MIATVFDESTSTVHFITVQSAADVPVQIARIGLSPLSKFFVADEVYGKIHGEKVFRLEDGAVMTTDTNGGQFLISEYVDVSKLDLAKEKEEIERNCFTFGGKWDGLTYVLPNGAAYTRAELVATKKLSK